MRTWILLMSAAAMLVIFLTGWRAGEPTPSKPVTTTSAPGPTSRREGLGEDEKIELLINKVAKLKDAVFIRNGKEYDCAAAAKHMRDKWEWKKNDIHTAKDFIQIAASKSSTSGEVYQIKFKDGRSVTSGSFLSGLLAEIESVATSRPTSTARAGS